MSYIVLKALCCRRSGWGTYSITQERSSAVNKNTAEPQAAQAIPIDYFRFSIYDCIFEILHFVQNDEEGWDCHATLAMTYQANDLRLLRRCAPRNDNSYLVYRMSYVASCGLQIISPKIRAKRYAVILAEIYLRTRPNHIKTGNRLFIGQPAKNSLNVAPPHHKASFGLKRPALWAELTIGQ